MVNSDEGHIEECLQVIFLFAGRDGGDDLIEIEIDKKVGRGDPLVRNTVGGARRGCCGREELFL